MHFFDKIALSMVHFSDERVSHVCYMGALYPPRIVWLLYGYSMVIVWCVRGKWGHHHPMVAQTGKWSEYFTLSTSHFIGVRLREQRI